MRYIAGLIEFFDFHFLPAASNDNEDLLDIGAPHENLAFIRSMKMEMVMENASTGLLLRSRKQRRFFQEIVDAETYITLRYFSPCPSMERLKFLKRKILDTYLFPKGK